MVFHSSSHFIRNTSVRGGKNVVTPDGFKRLSTQSSKNKYACKNRKLDQQPGNKKKPYYISSSFQHYCKYVLHSESNEL